MIELKFGHDNDWRSSSNFWGILPGSACFEMAYDVEGFPLSSGLNTWLCKLGQEWDKKNWPLKPIFWAPLCMAITRRGPKVVPWVGTDVIGQVALLWKQTRERWIGWNLENLHFDNLYPKCGFNLLCHYLNRDISIPFFNSEEKIVSFVSSNIFSI